MNVRIIMNETDTREHAIRVLKDLKAYMEEHYPYVDVELYKEGGR